MEFWDGRPVINAPLVVASPALPLECLQKARYRDQHDPKAKRGSHYFDDPGEELARLRSGCLKIPCNRGFTGRVPHSLQAVH
jgi:hypothetical protein